MKMDLEDQAWIESHTCEACEKSKDDVMVRPELDYQLLCLDCTEYMMDCRREREGCYISKKENQK